MINLKIIKQRDFDTDIRLQKKVIQLFDVNLKIQKPEVKNFNIIINNIRQVDVDIEDFEKEDTLSFFSLYNKKGALTHSNFVSSDIKVIEDISARRGKPVSNFQEIKTLNDEELKVSSLPYFNVGDLSKINFFSDKFFVYFSGIASLSFFGEDINFYSFISSLKKKNITSETFSFDFSEYFICVLNPLEEITLSFRFKGGERAFLVFEDSEFENKTTSLIETDSFTLSVPEIFFFKNFKPSGNTNATQVQFKKNEDAWINFTEENLLNAKIEVYCPNISLEDIENSKFEEEPFNVVSFDNSGILFKDFVPFSVIVKPSSEFIQKIMKQLCFNVEDFSYETFNSFEGELSSLSNDFFSSQDGIVIFSEKEQKLSLTFSKNEKINTIKFAENIDFTNQSSVSSFLKFEIQRNNGDLLTKEIIDIEGSDNVEEVLNDSKGFIIEKKNKNFPVTLFFREDVSVDIISVSRVSFSLKDVIFYLNLSQDKYIKSSKNIQIAELTNENFTIKTRLIFGNFKEDQTIFCEGNNTKGFEFLIKDNKFIFCLRKNTELFILEREVPYNVIPFIPYTFYFLIDSENNSLKMKIEDENLIFQEEKEFSPLSGFFSNQEFSIGCFLSGSPFLGIESVNPTNFFEGYIQSLQVWKGNKFSEKFTTLKAFSSNEDLLYNWYFGDKNISIFYDTQSNTDLILEKQDSNWGKIAYFKCFYSPYHQILISQLNGEKVSISKTDLAKNTIYFYDISSIPDFFHPYTLAQDIVYGSDYALFCIPKTADIGNSFEDLGNSFYFENKTDSFINDVPCHLNIRRLNIDKKKINLYEDVNKTKRKDWCFLTLDTNQRILKSNNLQEVKIKIRNKGLLPIENKYVDILCPNYGNGWIGNLEGETVPLAGLTAENTATTDISLWDSNYIRVNIPLLNSEEEKTLTLSKGNFNSENLFIETSPDFSILSENLFCDIIFTKLKNFEPKSSQQFFIHKEETESSPVLLSNFDKRMYLGKLKIVNTGDYDIVEGEVIIDVRKITQNISFVPMIFIDSSTREPLKTIGYNKNGQLIEEYQNWDRNYLIFKIKDLKQMIAKDFFILAGKFEGSEKDFLINKIKFQGKTFIDCGNLNLIARTNKISIKTKVILENFNAHQTIFCEGDSQNGIEFLIKEGELILAVISSGTLKYLSLPIITTLQKTKEYVIQAIIDFSGEDVFLHLKIDGVLQKTLNAGNLSIIAGTETASIGSFKKCSPFLGQSLSENGGFFQGYINNVQIWSIYSLENEDFEEVTGTEESLLNAWKIFDFSRNDGEIITDKTGNNNGVLSLNLGSGSLSNFSVDYIVSPENIFYPPDSKITSLIKLDTNIVEKYILYKYIGINEVIIDKLKE